MVRGALPKSWPLVRSKSQFCKNDSDLVYNWLYHRLGRSSRRQYSNSLAYWWGNARWFRLYFRERRKTQSTRDSALQTDSEYNGRIRYFKRERHLLKMFWSRYARDEEESKEHFVVFGDIQTWSSNWKCKQNKSWSRRRTFSNWVKTKWKHECWEWRCANDRGISWASHLKCN